MLKQVCGVPQSVAGSMRPAQYDAAGGVVSVLAATRLSRDLLACCSATSGMG